MQLEFKVLKTYNGGEHSRVKHNELQPGVSSALAYVCVYVIQFQLPIFQIVASLLVLTYAHLMQMRQSRAVCITFTDTQGAHMQHASYALPPLCDASVQLRQNAKFDSCNDD